MVSGIYSSLASRGEKSDGQSLLGRYYRSVSNPDALAAYARLSGPAVTAAGGRILVRGMTYAVRPVGCWAPKGVPVAVEQSSGRDRLTIHNAIDTPTRSTLA
jgi:hypothetical protein